MKFPKVGEDFSHWYPACNKLGIPLEWVRRTTFVEAIRNYADQAITPEQFLERPLLRRGAMLIYGRDKLLGEPRKFYLEATPDFYLPTLKIGLFNPDETLVDWIGTAYKPNRKDRTRMYDEVKKRMEWLARQPQLGLTLGIFRGEVAF